MYLLEPPLLKSWIRHCELCEQFKSSCEASGKLVPKADGVLIFDEVKVISRLMWNSRSQTIVGLAMDAEDQATLHDVAIPIISQRKGS